MLLRSVADISLTCVVATPSEFCAFLHATQQDATFQPHCASTLSVPGAQGTQHGHLPGMVSTGGGVNTIHGSSNKSTRFIIVKHV